MAVKTNSGFSNLDSFNRCVAAVIARFSFYAEGDEEWCGEVAEELG